MHKVEIPDELVIRELLILDTDEHSAVVDFEGVYGLATLRATRTLSEEGVSLELVPLEEAAWLLSRAQLLARHWLAIVGVQPSGACLRRPQCNHVLRIG
jgi:hypothetical protein